MLGWTVGVDHQYNKVFGIVRLDMDNLNVMDKVVRRGDGKVVIQRVSSDSPGKILKETKVTGRQLEVILGEAEDMLMYAVYEQHAYPESTLDSFYAYADVLLGINKIQ